MSDQDQDHDYNQEGDSILDIDTSDAVEPSAVEAGEYKVRITGQRKVKDENGVSRVVRTGDTGNQYFIITFDIPAEEASKGFSKIFSVPTDSMEPKRRNSAKWTIEEFKRCFGLLDLNWTTMIGKEGYVLLNKESSEKYGEQNGVVKFLVPAF